MREFELYHKGNLKQLQLFGLVVGTERVTQLVCLKNRPECNLLKISLSRARLEAQRLIRGLLLWHRNKVKVTENKIKGKDL